MKNCKLCDNTFQETTDRTTFCCHTCQAKYAIKKARTICKGRKKTGSIISCISCKKEFYIPKYRADTGKSKYCSRKCLAKIHLSPFIKKYGFQKTGNPEHKYKTITVNGKQKRLHRHIMEEHLGRKLERWEHVHHINGNSQDNSLENLVVLSNSDHQKEEYKYRKKITSS